MRRRALERLHAYQDEVLAIVREGEALLGDEARRDTAGLARTRWTLIRALTAYQLFKHLEILDPRIAGRGADAAIAARLKTACIAIGDDFRRHVQQWSGTDVEAHWAAYRPAALAMTARIRAHVERERVAIGALLGAAA